MKKQFTAILAAAVLASAAVAPVVSGSITAWADGNATITITNSVDSVEHTYTAYQIFAGKIESGELTEIEWGSTITGVTDGASSFLTQLKNVDGSSFSGSTNPFSDCTSAAAVAKVLVDQSFTIADLDLFAETAASWIKTNSGSSIGLGKGSSSVSITITDGTSDSYVLITDSVENSVTGQFAISKYMLMTYDADGSNSKTVKSSLPTIDKVVSDEADDGNGDSAATTKADPTTGSWYETADHSIYENFQMKLIAVIPSDSSLTAYDTYSVTFNDSMSSGLTYVSLDSVMMYYGASDTTGYDLKTNSAITYDDTWFTANTAGDGSAKTLKVNDVVSALTAYDTGNTGYGLGKDTITIEVTYTVYLNENAKTVSANGDLTYTSGSGDNVNENDVYLTYSNNPYDSTGTGTTTKDDVGIITYKITNKKVANVSNGTALAGAKFQLRTSADSADSAIYMYYNSDKQAYVVCNSSSDPSGLSPSQSTTIESQSDGSFNIIGLDYGTYYLVETEAPSGYNLADTVTITVTAKHSETASNAGVTVADVSESVKLTNMNNEVVDKSGAELPETGGIGTTVFYVVGGVLVVGAGVLLVTKKRAKDAK